MTRTKPFIRYLATLLLALAALAAVASPAAVNAQEDVDLQELLENSDQYLEQDITVTGHVDDILNAAAFTLTGEDVDGNLLVSATPETIPIELADDAQVEVTGTLEVFDTADPADWDTGIDPEAGVFLEYDGDPILVAESIMVMADDGQDQQNDQDVTPATIQVILGDAEAVAGDTVQVNGLVQDVLNDQSFTISSDDADADLLVIGATNMMPSGLTEDALVQVQGTVEIFDVDSPGDWNADEIGIDPTDDIYTDFDQQPVIVADEVRVVAPALGEMIDAILDDTDAYVGTDVNVLAEVADQLDENERAFTLEGTDGFLGLTETNLLVVGSINVMPGEMPDDAVVQVQGTVEIFDVDNPDDWGAEEIGIDVTDDLFDDFDGDPVIVASSVKVLTSDRGATVEDILENIEFFVGDTVTVGGSVDDVLEENQQAFALEGTDGFLGISEENLLVVGAPDTMPEALSDDLIVVVTGTLATFDRDDPAAWGADEIGIDVNDDVFDDFDGDPVLVADSIQTVAVD